MNFLLLQMTLYSFGIVSTSIPDPTTPFLIRTNATGAGCLAATATTFGDGLRHHVTLEPCALKVDYVRWTFNATGNGTYFIYNVGTGPSVRLSSTKSPEGNVVLILDTSNDGNPREYWALVVSRNPNRQLA